MAILNFLDGVKVPEEFIFKSKSRHPKVQQYFFFQRPEEFKHWLLGKNLDLNQSIEHGFTNVKHLWFTDYLNEATTDNDVAQVTIFCRVVRREEILFQNSKMNLNLDSKATHFVEEVAFGTELFCSMRKSIEWNRETKESVEASIYMASKAYLSQVVESNFSNIQPPEELSNVTFTILSNLKPVSVEDVRVLEFTQRLKEAINSDLLDEKLRPITIVLRLIPGKPDILSKLKSKREDELKLKKQQIEDMWKWIDNESLVLQSLIHHIPPFMTATEDFRALLEPLQHKVEKCYFANRTDLCELVRIKTVQRILNLMTDIIDWLIYRKNESNEIIGLVNGIPMSMYDKNDIENRKITNGGKYVKVFILKVNYVQDSLMESIKKTIGLPDTSFKFPFFPIMSREEEERYKSIRKMFKTFTDEARRSLLSPSTHESSDYIGVVPMSSPLDDGDIR